MEAVKETMGQTMGSVREQAQHVRTHLDHVGNNLDKELQWDGFHASKRRLGKNRFVRKLLSSSFTRLKIDLVQRAALARRSPEARRNARAPLRLYRYGGYGAHADDEVRLLRVFPFGPACETQQGTGRRLDAAIGGEIDISSGHPVPLLRVRAKVAGPVHAWIHVRPVPELKLKTEIPVPNLGFLSDFFWDGEKAIAAHTPPLPPADAAFLRPLPPPLPAGAADADGAGGGAATPPARARSEGRARAKQNRSGLQISAQMHLPLSLNEFDPNQAKFFFQLRTPMNSGLHMTPTEVRFDEKFFIAERTSLRVGASCGFPNQFPDFDPTELNIKLQRLCLATELP